MDRFEPAADCRARAARLGLRRAHVARPEFPAIWLDAHRGVLALAGGANLLDGSQTEALLNVRRSVLPRLDGDACLAEARRRHVHRFVADVASGEVPSGADRCDPD